MIADNTNDLTGWMAWPPTTAHAHFVHHVSSHLMSFLLSDLLVHPYTAGHSTSVSTRTCYPEKSASPSAPGSTTARVGLYFTLLGECELPGVIINHGLVLIIQYEMWC